MAQRSDMPFRPLHMLGLVGLVLTALTVLFLAGSHQQGPSATSSQGPLTRIARLVQEVPAVPPVGSDPQVVDFPEIAEGTWTELNPLPQPLGEVASGILFFEGTPYIVTVGEQEDEDGPSPTLLYNLATLEFTQAAERPLVGHHHAAEVIDNVFYVFGGLEGGQNEIQTGTLVGRDDGTVDVEWQVAGPLAFESGSAATALIDGRVYYCGGIDPSIQDTVDTCAVYDPATGMWVQDADVPPMPMPRNHAAACTDGLRMYVFGGREGGNVVGESFADSQILTPGEGWTMGTPMPVPLGGMGKGVYYEGACYVFGGEVSNDVPAPDDANRISDTRTSYGAYRYDLATDSWTAVADMPVALHGLFPVALEDFVFINGGGVQSANSQSTTNLAYAFDSAWAPAPAPDAATSGVP